jgi:hypothetical protein
MAAPALEAPGMSSTLRWGSSRPFKTIRSVSHIVSTQTAQALCTCRRGRGAHPAPPERPTRSRATERWPCCTPSHTHILGSRPGMRWLAKCRQVHGQLASTCGVAVQRRAPNSEHAALQELLLRSQELHKHSVASVSLATVICVLSFAWAQCCWDVLHKSLL